MSEEILKEGKFFVQNNVENKQLKDENEQLRKENEELRKNNAAKILQNTKIKKSGRNIFMSSKDGDDNENDKTLMSSKDGDEMDNILMSSKDGDDETMNQNNNNIIKQLNDSLDKIIKESKSFKDQIKSIRKVEI